MANWTFVREVTSGDSKTNNYMGDFEVFATYQGEAREVWDVFVKAAVQHATQLAQGLWNEHGCTWSRSGDSLIMRVPIRPGSRPGNHMYFRYSLLEDLWSWPAQTPAQAPPVQHAPPGQALPAQGQPPQGYGPPVGGRPGGYPQA